MIKQMLEVLLILEPIVAGTFTQFRCQGEPVKICTIEADSRTTLYQDDNAVWDSNMELGKRVVFDENNDAWILNFTQINEGFYLKKTQSENGSRVKESCGKLLISVPPSPDCKPIINEVQDIYSQELYQLNLSLPKSGCGTPHVEAFWINSQENTTLLRVNATEKPRTYTACIRGPAMACERNRPHTDYCSFIDLNLSRRCSTDPEKTPTECRSSICDIITCLILAIVVAAIIGFILRHVRCQFCRRQENGGQINCEASNGTEELQELHPNATA